MTTNLSTFPVHKYSWDQIIDKYTKGYIQKYNPSQPQKFSNISEMVQNAATHVMLSIATRVDENGQIPIDIHGENLAQTITGSNNLNLLHMLLKRPDSAPKPLLEDLQSFALLNDRHNILFLLEGFLNEKPIQDAFIDFLLCQDAEVTDKDIKMFVAMGADLEQTDQQGLTPLLLAAHKNPKSILPLITAGANVKAKGNDGDTILEIIKKKDVQLFKKVKETIKMRTSVSTFQSQTYSSWDELINKYAKSYIQNYNPSQPQKSSNTSEMTRSAAVHVMLSLITKVDEKGRISADKHGETIAQTIMRSDNLNLLHMLLNRPDSAPKPLLEEIQWLASLNDRHNIAFLLEGILNKKPMQDAFTDFLICQDAEVTGKDIKMFVARGASLEQTDQEGRTPLLLAAHKNPKSILPLIASGANIRAKGSDGNTILEIIEEKDVQLFNKIKKKIKVIDMFFMNAMQQKETTALVMAIKESISRGANVNQVDATGLTPLIKAIVGKLPIFENLIQNGADVNAVGPDGKTPLVIAAKFQPNLVQALIEAGAKN